MMVRNLPVWGNNLGLEQGNKIDDMYMMTSRRIEQYGYKLRYYQMTPGPEKLMMKYSIRLK